MNNDNELLFVYGTLMNPAERLRLLGRPIDASPARLSGYTRGRKRYYFVAKLDGRGNRWRNSRRPERARF